MAGGLGCAFFQIEVGENDLSGPPRHQVLSQTLQPFPVAPGDVEPGALTGVEPRCGDRYGGQGPENDHALGLRFCHDKGASVRGEETRLQKAEDRPGSRVSWKRVQFG